MFISRDHSVYFHCAWSSYGDQTTSLKKISITLKNHLIEKKIGLKYLNSLHCNLDRICKYVFSDAATDLAQCGWIAIRDEVIIDISTVCQDRVNWYF
jgi:hypothetical protein